MKRRSFIQTGSAFTLPLLLKGMEVSALTASSLKNLINPESDKILILVQLSGGNDGLNTFIPLDQYSNLFNVRSSILLPENSVLKAQEINGFHPAMMDFKKLYDEGTMAVVQGVSYPNQNRSHFRSTDIWHTATDAEDFETSGWLGRYLAENYPNYPEAYPNNEYPDPFAITIGSLLSETCQGYSSNFSYAVSNKESFTLEETEEGNTDNSCYGKELSFVRTTIKQANLYSSVVKDAFDKGTNLATYADNNRLAQQLKLVANLISGGLKTKIYIVNQGGFDTHANQVMGSDTTTGDHATLLETLSAAIGSFSSDINQLGYGEKVLGMTYSEFGRRIKANDSFGTDHGTAAPLFVFGNCVNGGVFGENATITNDVDDQEGVAMQYDFRSVYASVLIDWFDADPELVQKVLYKDFQYIPFVKNCNAPNATHEITEAMQASIHPNPTNGHSILTYESEGGELHIELYNALGSRLNTLSSRSYSKGNHSIPLDLSHVTRGHYYIRLNDRKKSKSIKVVVL